MSGKTGSVEHQIFMCVAGIDIICFMVGVAFYSHSGEWPPCILRLENELSVDSLNSVRQMPRTALQGQILRNCSSLFPSLLKPADVKIVSHSACAYGGVSCSQCAPLAQLNNFGVFFLTLLANIKQHNT